MKIAVLIFIIFLVIVMFRFFSNLNKKNIVMKVIKSNIRNLIGPNFIKSYKYIINDILIKDNRLYISYSKKMLTFPSASSAFTLI